MKKKLLTLMALLTTVVSGAWAQKEDQNLPTTVLDLLEPTLVTRGNSGDWTTANSIQDCYYYSADDNILVVSAWAVCNSKSKQTWTNTDAQNANNGSTAWEADGVFKGAKYYWGNDYTGNYYWLKVRNTVRNYNYLVTNCTGVSARIANNSSSRTVTIAAYETTVEGSTVTPASTAEYTATSTANSTIGTKQQTISLSSLNKDKIYLIVVYASTDNDAALYEVAFNIADSRVATSEALKSSAAVKVGDDALDLDATTNGYSISGDNDEIITLSNDISVTSAPTNIKLVKTITYSDNSTEDADVDVTFDGTITGGYYIGAASIGLTGNVKDYTVRVKQNVNPWIDLTEDNISLKSTPVTRNASTTVTLTGGFLTNGTGTVTWTAVDGLTITPTSFTIADGEADQTFTITYNKDVATSGSVDVTFSDGTTSKVLTVNYSSVVAHEWATVSESTTWDWANLTTSEIKLTDDTTPTKSEEFLLGDMDGEILSQNINYTPATFNAEALKVITEYATRVQSSVNFMQGTQVRIKTSVPGTIQVWFSNTSTRTETDGNKRYVYINGKNTDTFSLNTTMTASNAITVPAGVITITARNGEDEATMIRISKIVFTANNQIEQEAITISCEGGFASYSCDKALDFSTSNAKAYIIKSTSANSATLTEITKVPANTGIIVAGTKDETINVLTTTDETDNVTGNLLHGTANSTKTVVKDEAYGLSKTDGLFHLMNAGTIPANKAYLLASEVFQGGTAPVLGLDFSNGDATAIDDVRSKMEDVRGDFYNLNGQRVSQPTKGLYIVNGKKVIMK